jgi:hypothetical protein
MDRQGLLGTVAKVGFGDAGYTSEGQTTICRMTFRQKSFQCSQVYKHFTAVIYGCNKIRSIMVLKKAVVRIGVL